MDQHLGNSTFGERAGRDIRRFPYLASWINPAELLLHHCFGHRPIHNQPRYGVYSDFYLRLFLRNHLTPWSYLPMQSISRIFIRQFSRVSSVPATRLSIVHSHLAPKISIRKMASLEIPKTMSGVIINKNGGTEVLEYKTDLPVPQPKEGEDLSRSRCPCSIC